jgi:hypothetical protein
MTKHVSPDELTDAKVDYERPDDGAIMRWDGVGSFNAISGSFEAKRDNSAAPKDEKVLPLGGKPKRKRNRSFSLSTARINIRGSNPDIQTCFRNGAEKHFRFPAKIYNAAGLDVPFEIFSVPGCTGTDARFMTWTPRGPFRERFPVRLLPEVSDETKTAAINRAKIAVYDAEFPQSTVPEHKIFGRASRNGSPQYGDETLKSLGEYIDLHGSTEPLQSNFMIGQRSQEMEMRPSPEEMAEVWNDSSIKYEIRTISAAPPLSQCGFATPFYTVMKIPVSGVVKYWVKVKGVSEDKLRSRRGNEGENQEKIDSEVKELATFERVSFKNRGSRWALCSIGGMRFAPLRHTDKNGRIVYIGQLMRNGAYDAQDKLVQPQALECPGSDKKFWAPLVPRDQSNKALPYNVDSEDEMKFGYCFGYRSDTRGKDDERPRPLDYIGKHQDWRATWHTHPRVLGSVANPARGTRRHTVPQPPWNALPGPG